MRNYLSDGDIVTRTAPVGGFTSGTPKIVGDEFLVPTSTVAATYSAACVKRGKVRLAAKPTEVWTEGAKVYWDDGNSYCEASDAADNYLIGTAEGAQSGGYVDVVLNGVSLASADGDLDAKANKVAPAAAHNFAGLTAAGDLEDSGHSHADYEAAGKMTTHESTYDHTDIAATAADLDALEVRAVHVLAPVIADWDPTDIGAGVVDPPTSVAGDRYIASATEAPYTTPRIYEYDGAAWVETAGDNGDVIFHEDDNVTKIFDGAGWRNVYDSANLLAFTGDSGAGGAIGLVPAPAAGDAAAGKVLGAGGGWVAPSVSGLNATGAEINEVADLSAMGARTRWVKLTIDDLAAGEHAFGGTLPTSPYAVEEFYLYVDTPESSGTTTVDIGTETAGGGDPDGFAVGLSVASSGGFRGEPTVTVGSTETYVASTTRGVLLADFKAGTDSAGDHGLYIEKPYINPGTLDLVYTVPAGGWTEFVGHGLVKIMEIA